MNAMARIRNYSACANTSHRSQFTQGWAPCATTCSFTTSVCVNMSSVNEGPEGTIKFIRYYRKNPVLWDTQRKDYSNSGKRRAAVDEIAKKTEMTAQQVKNKIKSLRSYFSKEHQKVIKSRTEGDEVYESGWFGYQPLQFILGLQGEAGEFDQVSDAGTSVTEGLGGEGDHMEASEDIKNILDEEAEDNIKNYEYLPRPTRRNLKRPLEQHGQKAMQFVDMTPNEFTVEKDCCSIFGELVSVQLRKLTRRNQAVAKHEIQNIFFKLEMEEIDQNSSRLRYSPDPSLATSPSNFK